MKFGRMQLGLLFTAAYTIGVVSLLVVRWEEVKGLDLNALGDFAAGAAGPIAFLWLVLGYFQQGDELALNTRALEAQAEELRESVRAQEELAKATREQTDASHKHEADRILRATERAQPVFDIEVTYLGGKFEDQVILVMRCTNIGAECAKLRMSAHDGQTTWREYRDKLARHDFTDLKAKFPGEAQVLVNVDLVYVDSEGNDRSQFCTIELTWVSSEQRYDHVVSNPKWFQESEA